MVVCAFCGDLSVEKALMAPRVRTARKKADAPGTTHNEPQAENQTDRQVDSQGRPAENIAQPPTAATPATSGALSTPSSAQEEALMKLRKHVESTSDYVGTDFASQARAMHDGEAPERAIYGEVKPEEAKALIEEGVPVAPLPFMPGRKTN